MFIDDEEEERSFVQRHPGLILLVIVLVVVPGIFLAARKLSSGHQSASRQEEIMIRLPPPPQPEHTPIPTPTPQQQPTPEQEKMVEQQPVQNEKKPEPPKERAPVIGTSITGPGGGPDLGLGNGLGEGNYGSEGAAGSKYGWYASEVQNRIADAVRNNPRTRKASMSVIVRIWPDSTGRITKVRVSSSTDDPSVDAALQNDILTGMQLTDPPPADMPLPIVMRLSAQRPQ